MKTVVVGDDAQQEIEQAALYYESKKPGLGMDFLAQLEKVFVEIRRSPQAFGFFQNSDYRKRQTKRFPYLVIYREREDYDADHATIISRDEQRRLISYFFSQAGSLGRIHHEIWLDGREEFWLGKMCAITIVLDHKDQKVCAKRLTSVVPIEKETFVDTLCRWLHLQ